MSMYQLFKTNSDLETKGIEIDYGSFVVTIARAGGSNQKYTAAIQRVFKPYRRAIQNNTMDEKVAEGLLQRVFATTVVLNWEVRQGDKLKQGIESPDGKIVPFNVENVLAAFSDLPELYRDLHAQADNYALFREETMEEDLKNS